MPFGHGYKKTPGTDAVPRWTPDAAWARLRAQAHFGGQLAAALPPWCVKSTVAFSASARSGFLLTHNRALAVAHCSPYARTSANNAPQRSLFPVSWRTAPACIVPYAASMPLALRTPAQHRSRQRTPFFRRTSSASRAGTMQPACAGKPAPMPINGAPDDT